MTADELRSTLKDLGTTAAAFNRYIGRDRHCMGRWTSGKVPTPMWAIVLLENLQRERDLRSALDPDFKVTLKLQPEGHVDWSYS